LSKWAGDRVFLHPEAKWTLENSDWVADPPAHFDKGRFRRLDDKTVFIGSRGAPVSLLLDPHWKYHRFTFVDRLTDTQAVMPPVLLEGRADADDEALTTRASWATAKGHLCLPWILDDRPESESSLVSFRTRPITYVDTLASPPALVVSARKTEPGVERLRYYDLPELWRSRDYLASSQNADPPRQRYQKLAGVATSDAAPLEISLDDIVVCIEIDDRIVPRDWKHSRGFALFSHHFAGGKGSRGENGLLRPDRANDRSTFSSPWSGEEDRNYLIADSDDWARLLLSEGDIYEIFDRRVSDGTQPGVGARAAVLMSHSADRRGNSPFAVREAFWSQEHQATSEPSYDPCRGGSSASSLGKGDLLALRCCGADGDVELAASLFVVFYAFTFTTQAAGAQAASQLSEAAQRKFVDRVTAAKSRFWSLGPAIETDVDQPKLRLRAVSHMMPVEGYQHVDITVWGGSGRENSSNYFDETGDETAHHEAGHHLGLPDEYIERWHYLSLREPGVHDYVAGSPYALDDWAMMESNYFMRPRYFWHRAVWLREVYGQDFRLVYEGRRYRLPHHPAAPTRNHVYWPLACALDQRHDAHGRFDVYLYPLGDEEWTGPLAGGPHDGLLVVVVKLHVKFHTLAARNAEARYRKMKDALSKLRDGVARDFQGKLAAAGTLDGRRFESCAVLFRVGFVVDNFIDVAEVREDTGHTTQAAWQERVERITRDKDVRLTIRTQGSGDSRWSDDTRLTLTLGKRLDRVFPRFFANMLGVSGADRGDPARYQHLARLIFPDGTMKKID
jgi:hypothetical protein